MIAFEDLDCKIRFGDGIGLSTDFKLEVKKSLIRVEIDQLQIPILTYIVILVNLCIFFNLVYYKM